VPPCPVGLRRPILALTLAALAAPAVGQSTGRLAGHIHTNHHHDGHTHAGRPHDSDVHDEEEISLPGVSITVSSPSLMGTRNEFTDAAGNFSFPSLPPGVCTTDVEMEGFLPQRRSEVEVRLNRVTEIHMDLEQGELTVVAQTPMVDPEQVSTSQSFSEEHIEESGARRGRTRRNPVCRRLRSPRARRSLSVADRSRLRSWPSVNRRTGASPTAWHG